MFDKNGHEIKTGDIVEITGAYFKNDNGLYFVEYITTMCIDNFRRIAGKTQREVSDAVGITLNNYARLERGEADVRKMSLENAMKLCEILRITPYELMNAGDNSRKAHKK